MKIDENDIFNLTPEEREEMIQRIITRVSVDHNNIKGKPRKTKWKDEKFVRGVILEYIKFLTTGRNADVNSEEGIIKENEAFSIIYSNFNFRNKPNPQKARDTFEVLEEFLSPMEANQIFKGFPKIVTTSLDELRKKLVLLQEYEYLQNICLDPKKLTGSYNWLLERLIQYTNMFEEGKETRLIGEIPASELLSDKDKFAKKETETEPKDVKKKEKTDVDDQDIEGR